jgi:DNA-binding MarR family transcriptional regulator
MSKAASRSETARAAALAAELRLLVGRLRRRLRAQAQFGDLSSSQVSALGHLERGGAATVTALAQAEGVRPQSMGATVAALEAAGLVQGAPHPSDGRQTLWSLTKACRDRIQASRAAREDWLQRAILAHLDGAEQKTLAQAVTLLKRLVDD